MILVKLYRCVCVCVRVCLLALEPHDDEYRNIVFLDAFFSQGSPTELSGSDSEPENDAAQKGVSETATIIEISDDEVKICWFAKLFRWQLLLDF